MWEFSVKEEPETEEPHYHDSIMHVSSEVPDEAMEVKVQDLNQESDFPQGTSKRLTEGWKSASSFKIVQRIENGSLVLLTVPSKWESNGICKWPLQNVEKLQRDPTSMPKDNWRSYNCVVKRNDISTFYAAEKIKRNMSDSVIESCKKKLLSTFEIQEHQPTTSFKSQEQNNAIPVSNQQRIQALETATRLRATPEQFLTLLEFMERHGDIAKHQGGAMLRLRNERLWLELTRTINTRVGGVKKSRDKWRKVWADWKSKSKKKYMSLRNSPDTNGEPNKQALTALEKRVLAVMTAPPRALRLHTAASEPSEQMSNDEQPSWTPPSPAPVTSPQPTPSPPPSPPPPSPSPPPPTSPQLQPESTPTQHQPTTTQHQPPSTQYRQILKQHQPTLTQHQLHKLQLQSIPIHYKLIKIKRPPTQQQPQLPKLQLQSTPTQHQPQLPKLQLPSTPTQHQPTVTEHQPTPTQYQPQSAVLRRRRRPQLNARNSIQHLASQFAAIEQRRLRMEISREKWTHEIELRRLEIDRERNELARENKELLRQFSGVVEQLVDVLRQSTQSDS